MRVLTATCFAQDLSQRRRALCYHTDLRNGECDCENANYPHFSDSYLRATSRVGDLRRPRRRRRVIIHGVSP